MTYVIPSLSGAACEMYGHDDTDDTGNPGGGYAKWRTLAAHPSESQPIPSQLFWQDGPLDRAAGQPPNGVFVEDVLEACRRRLVFYQEGRFPADENAVAMGHIVAAISALMERRVARRKRKVEGQHRA